MNHVIACTWYFIGSSTGDGWFLEQGISELEINIVETGYVLAMHWSITQFHGSMDVQPGNLTERMFAVIVLVAGMLTFSVFVSLVTDMIFQVRQQRKRYNAQRQRLRAYFLRHKVSTELMMGVKRYLECNTGQESQFLEDRELLQALPVSWQKSVLVEARTPTIDCHAVFAWIKDSHAAAYREVCHSGFITMQVLAGSGLFSAWDLCTSMYFVEHGTLRYLIGRGSQSAGSRLSSGRSSQVLRQISRMHAGVKLIKKQWICELAIWVQDWQTRGDL